MGYYHLDLDELSAYSGVSIEELKNRSFTQLEAEIKAMKEDKIAKQNNKNAADKEYERIVLKFFRPVPYLRHWFADREIVLACAFEGLMEYDICGRRFVDPGTELMSTQCEYLRTSTEYVKQYDEKGRELLERKAKEVDVYRVASEYQHTRHGGVVLRLLYGRYPELEKFGFEAYGMNSGMGYEIYPKNHIYTPFTALMSGNVDQILFRNREYCKLYNNGRYSPEECEKAFRTDEAREMFDTIRKIGGREHILGHSPVTVDEMGAVTADGLSEKHASDGALAEGEPGIRLLKKYNKVERGQKESFYLYLTKPYDVNTLLSDFWKLVGHRSKVHAHIYDIWDHLGEYGFDLNLDTAKIDSPAPGLVYKNGCCFDYTVADTFGWREGDTYHLTIRIECPEIGR